MQQPLSVLALQPYFGGSHAQFHQGWLANSDHHWTTLKLPARHWKWRMRHSAIHFVKQIHELADQGQSWDVILATDMMNIAELRGLLRDELRRLPIVLYFHENQFVYPNQWTQKRDRHFPFTNFISALAADQLWFNSQFNLDSLLEELRKNVKQWPDFPPVDEIETLIGKSQIQPPGIDKPPFDISTFQAARQHRLATDQPIHLVWAARWEHDKDPDSFYDALRQLRALKVPFQLSLIGQSFRTVPPVFEKIKSTFGDQICKWGYQATRLDYWKALAEADLFVSTAKHEFFGLSAAEAIAAGTFPLLPNRLAYPELLSYAFDQKELSKHLYDGGSEGLAARIESIVNTRGKNPGNENTDASSTLLSNLRLETRGRDLDEALRNLVESD